MPRSARWRRTARSGRACVRLLLLAFTAAACFGAGPAWAGTDFYCSGCTVSSGLEVTGPSHSLTGSRGTNNSGGTGCGGASSYGSYYCGAPSGCHTYSGSYVLTPGIRHPYGSWRSMNGYSTWGSDGPPSYCSYSSVYAVGRDGAPSARDPEGIPVLDRSAVRAPKELDQVFPRADLAAARTFSTPAGDGYVVVDAEKRLVCLAIDDRGTGYGYSCHRTGEVQAAGILVSLEDGDGSSAAGDLVVGVAADGVEALQVGRADGTTRTVPVEGGVAVALLGASDRSVALPAGEDAPAGVAGHRLVTAR